MLQDPNDLTRHVAEEAEGPLQRLLLKLWASSFNNAAEIKGCLTQAWRRGFMSVAAGAIQKDVVSFHFGRQSPLEIASADAFAAQFVRELEDDQRVTINELTTEAARRGLGPPALARQLKEGLGLTAAQARAIGAYRRALETGSRKALEYRLRDQRFDDTTEAAVQGGSPLSAAQIDQRVARYADRYRAYRATTIARYETLFAANAGAYAAAQTLPAASVKHWMLARDERVCPRCRSVLEIQPDGVPLNGMFQWQHHGKSGSILHPPLHPDCRCTLSYGVR